MIPSPIKSKSVYEWNMRPGFSFQGDAQVIGDRLEAIMNQNAGALTPGVVVEDASDPESPLYQNFEWDDQKAARMQRIIAARNLIGSIIVVAYDDKPVVGTVRAFVNVTRGKEHFYTTTIYALSDAELHSQVLEKAWREIQLWRKQYQDLKQLSDVFRVIDDFVFPSLSVTSLTA